jgi:hypothetical protein
MVTYYRRHPSFGLAGLAVVEAGWLAIIGDAQAATIEQQFQGTNLQDEFNMPPHFGFIPPDMGGAVGPTNVVQIINGAYAVYAKEGGALQTRTPDSTFWLNAGIPASIVNTGLSDPRII